MHARAFIFVCVSSIYESLFLPLAPSLSLTVHVKTGMASAANVPVDNVDLKKDARRTVTYTVTGTFTAPHYRWYFYCSQRAREHLSGCVRRSVCQGRCLGYIREGQSG